MAALFRVCELRGLEARIWSRCGSASLCGKVGGMVVVQEVDSSGGGLERRTIGTPNYLRSAAVG